MSRPSTSTRTVQVDAGWSGGTVTESLTVDVTTPPPSTVPLAARFDWSPTTVEVGQPVTFADRSTGPPDAWTWTFAGARDSGTSSAQSPPPQVWYTAGQHTVTLTVRRGGETNTWSAVITVVEPPAGTPMLGRIGTTTAPPPYNTVTDYTFDVTIAGDFTSCTWTIEGIDTPCTLEASHGPGLTQADVVHRFGSPGTKTVRITVGWSGGTVTDSEIFEVV